MVRSSKSTRKPIQSPHSSREQDGETQFGSAADRFGYPGIRSVGSRHRKIHKEASANYAEVRISRALLRRLILSAARPVPRLQMLAACADAPHHLLLDLIGLAEQFGLLLRHGDRLVEFRLTCDVGRHLRRAYIRRRLGLRVRDRTPNDGRWCRGARRRIHRVTRLRIRAGSLISDSGGIPRGC